MNPVKAIAEDAHIREIATGKVAQAVGIGTATTPAWVEWVVGSPEAQAVVILVGVCVSLSILGINLQSIWIRHHNFTKSLKGEEDKP